MGIITLSHSNLKFLFFLGIWVFILSAHAAPFKKELFLSIKLNGEDTHRIATFIQTTEKKLWIEEDEIKLWHIKLPTTNYLIYHHHRFFPLFLIKNITYKINQLNLSITITIPPALFSHSYLEGYHFSKIIPQKSSLGGFLNYDLNDQRIAGNDQLNGLFEGGIFNSYGVLTTSELAKIAGTEHKKIRLSTTWTKDFPELMHTFRLGDTFTNPSMSGQSVGFGGIQWSTNFATQPYFIPFPLPQMRGVAAVPSSIDLYVNNALISRSNIPSGPFSITNIPTITGEGNVNVVVTDLLGRQQIINLPFYGSSSLLKPNLTSSSVELGFLRNNYGVENNDYSQLFFSTLQRHGINDTHTHEWSTELSKEHQTIGLGETLLIKKNYLLNIATSLSHANGFGELGLIGIQHLSATGMNYGMNFQMTSRKFFRLGMQPNSFLPSVQSQWFVGFSLKQVSYNLSLTQQINRNQPNTTFFTFNINKTIAHSWALNFTGLHSFGREKNTAVFLTLTHAIDDRKNVSSTLVAQNEASEAQFNLQQNLPTDTGIGYNLNFAQGSNFNYLNTLSGQTSSGNYYATIAHQSEQTGYQFDTNGAIASLENHFYFSRLLSDSFGVANLPGYKNIDVYLNNQKIGKTNSAGNVFIPGLMPYNKNIISIKPTDFPMNTMIDKTQISIVPYYRSGIVIHFPVYPAADGVAIVHLISGEPLPAGTLVQLNNNQTIFPVGNNGMLYLSHLQSHNHLQAKWGNSQCEFDLIYQFSKKPVPFLGNYVCQKLK